MVDSNDRDRIVEARDELHRMLNEVSGRKIQDSRLQHRFRVQHAPASIVVQALSAEAAPLQLLSTRLRRQSISTSILSPVVCDLAP